MGDRNQIVLCVHDRANNSSLSVRVGGRIIGRILEDRPGQWVVLPEPKAPVVYPSLEAVVDALLTATEPKT